MSNNILDCFECKKRFNLVSREPINMVCCGRVACRYCVKTKMIKTPQNAERAIAEKGDFECTACHS